MAIRILIVEDSKSTGSMLTSYLVNHLASVANDEDCAPVTGGKAGDWAGHLRQLRPFAWKYAPADFDVRLLSTTELESLSAAALKPSELREAMAQASLRVFSEPSECPDILLVDLALSSEETQKLIDSGGNEEPGPKAQENLRDPRDTLETLAGFRILQSFGEHMPVIATSYARNPLVAQHCIMNSAHGVLRKPVVGHHSEVEGEDHRGWDMASASKLPLEDLQVYGQQNQDPLAVVVGQYLSMASAEVLKATHSCILRRVDQRDPAESTRAYLSS